MKSVIFWSLQKIWSIVLNLSESFFACRTVSMNQEVSELNCEISELNCSILKLNCEFSVLRLLLYFWCLFDTVTQLSESEIVCELTDFCKQNTLSTDKLLKLLVWMSAEVNSAEKLKLLQFELALLESAYHCDLIR